MTFSSFQRYDALVRLTRWVKNEVDGDTARTSPPEILTGSRPSCTGQDARTHIYAEKEKGRDLGYALAASSCEGVNGVESCTITAFDVITAFAVLTPAAPRRAAGFFGSGRPPGYPGQRITQLTSDWLILFEPTLSAVDARKSKCFRRKCQRRFSVQPRNRIVDSVDHN